MLGDWVSGLLCVLEKCSDSLASQTVGMIQLSAEEKERYKGIPVFLDFDSGLYIFPVSFPLLFGPGILSVTSSFLRWRCLILVIPSEMFAKGRVGRFVTRCQTLYSPFFGVLVKRYRKRSVRHYLPHPAQSLRIHMVHRV